MKRPLLVRADASPTIGTGHVMRMLALGQEWMGRGGEIYFVSAECPDSLISRLESEGMKHLAIDTMPGGELDAELTCDLIQRHRCSWAILDGYRFNTEFQRRLKSVDIRLLVVDDFRYVSSWHADAILNQNMFAENWSYQSEVPDAQFLLGSQYVLLRKELIDCPPGAKPADSAVGLRLLITLGGGDAASVSIPLIEILESVHHSPLSIRLIIGSACSNKAELAQIVRSSRHEVQLVHDVKDMSEQFLWSDAVISGAGSTCWEWLYYQRPGAIIRMADNQNPVADELVKRELAVDLGWHSELQSSLGIVQLLEDFLHDVESSLSTEGLNHRNSLIDGRGAERVCDLISD